VVLDAGAVTKSHGCPGWRGAVIIPNGHTFGSTTSWLVASEVDFDLGSRGRVVFWWTDDVDGFSHVTMRAGPFPPPSPSSGSRSGVAIAVDASTASDIDLTTLHFVDAAVVSPGTYTVVTNGDAYVYVRIEGVRLADQGYGLCLAIDLSWTISS
jgi:hypothetical protein